MKFIALLIPESYIKALDELVKEKLYPNRNEAVRLAIRDLLQAHKKWGDLVIKEVQHNEV